MCWLQEEELFPYKKQPHETPGRGKLDTGGTTIQPRQLPLLIHSPVPAAAMQYYPPLVWPYYLDHVSTPPGSSSPSRPRP